MPADKRSPEARQRDADKEITAEAHDQAEKDISNDPDLSPAPDPGADLDEGELARLEGED